MTTLWTSLFHKGFSRRSSTPKLQLDTLLYILLTLKRWGGNPECLLWNPVLGGCKGPIWLLTTTPAALPAVLVGCGVCSSKPGVWDLACYYSWIQSDSCSNSASLVIATPPNILYDVKKEAGGGGIQNAAFGKHCLKNSWQSLCLGGFWKRNQNKASCLRDQKQINTSLFWKAVSLPFSFGSIISLMCSG